MRVLALIVALLPLQVQAAEIVLTGPPIWESAPLIALAESQPVDGVTFTFRPWGSPEELRKTIMSDQPAMAVAPSPTAAIFAASGIGLRVMSAAVTEGSISIVGRGAPVARLGDLEGASLALPFKGYLPDLMMRRIAQPGSESWQPHYTGNPVAGMQLLIAGRVDTALLAEPMATLALTQDAALGRRADLCMLWRDATALADCPPAGVVVVNDAFENNPQIRGAYLAAFHALAANPGNAADLLSLHFPHMDRARAGFSRIRALDLPMPERQDVLAAFFAEIMSIEPAAIGGALPGPDFYGR
ncbi:sulfonate/nitrate transport system substrate-binding protein [Nitratireductor aquibiodomus RA22]|uniref:Sulfonate/nitrate transport system substrate-binding protein n=1 Tax=Nitratireductor aquibiodomus RA22 TaxID=1189611 RepID=I5C5A7_9HYPH|nr:ABC transporter substrate-binding protein [Nitratireductor aquibiodomus]EIM77009.1 sulfonate/nitrate transport system substrate-binding protein [Nitratireductor aquibiodomus RA22]